MGLLGVCVVCGQPLMLWHKKSWLALQASDATVPGDPGRLNCVTWLLAQPYALKVYDSASTSGASGASEDALFSRSFAASSEMERRSHTST